MIMRQPIYYLFTCVNIQNKYLAKQTDRQTIGKKDKKTYKDSQFDKNFCKKLFC